MSKVKCVICGEIFDKDKKNNEDKEPYIKIGNRYAHIGCFENSEEGHKLQLEMYIKKIMKLDKISALIKRQIEKYYTENHYSYKSMLFTLKFFYEIKKENPAKARGIGIIEYVYEDAKKYYSNLNRAIVANQNINTENKKTRVITINSPQRKCVKKYIDLNLIKGE